MAVNYVRHQHTARMTAMQAAAAFGTLILLTDTSLGGVTNSIEFKGTASKHEIGVLDASTCMSRECAVKIDTPVPDASNAFSEPASQASLQLLIKLGNGSASSRGQRAHAAVVAVTPAP